MNFLNLFLLLNLLFLLSSPLDANNQTSKNSNSTRPKPIVNQISSLPIAHFSSFDKIIAGNTHIVLLAGNKRLWAFDGVNWESVTFPKKPAFHTSQSDTCFYTSYDGVVERFVLKQNGNISRDSLISIADLHEPISGVAADGDGVLYIATGNSLWCYSDSLLKLGAFDENIRLFCNNSMVYFTKGHHKLYSITTNKITQEKSFSLLLDQTNNIIDIIDINNAPHIVAEGFPWIYPINGSNKTPPFELKLFMGGESAKVKQVRTLQEKIYLLTSNNSIIKIGHEGKIIAMDLNDHPSLGITLDILPFSNTSVLALTPTEIFSISGTEYSGIYTGFCNSNSKPTSIATSNKYIYFGTTEQVFAASRTNPINELHFDPINGISGQVIQMQNCACGTFLATSKAIYQLLGQRAKLIMSSKAFVGKQICFAEHNNRLWIVFWDSETISVQQVTPTIFPLKLVDIPNSIQSIKRVDYFDGQLIVQPEIGICYTLPISDLSAWKKTVEHDMSSSQLLFTNDQTPNPFVWKSGNLFYFDAKKGGIGNLIIADSTCSLSPIASNDTSLAVLRTLTPFSNISTIWHYQLSQNNIESRGIPMALYPTNESIKQSLQIESNTLLIVSSAGLHYYKTPSIKPYPPTASISNLTLYSNEEQISIKSGYFSKNTLARKASQSPSLRNLRAAFGSNNSRNWETNSSNIQFSTYLEGYDKGWTTWSNTSIREVNKLSPGKYKLHVKSKNFWGLQSLVSSVSFTVTPYFYESVYFILSFIILGTLALYAMFKWRRYLHAKVRHKLESLINTRTEELVREKEKTDNLLARVLPKETASELKEKGRVNTQRFQVVTVLFCDIEGFTRITDETNPEVLIDQLDKFFLYFDSVVERYRIEKIKTIGDAYMCAGGIPQKNRTNPVEVVLAALEMLQHMKDIMHQNSNEHNIWEIRIGIDTGPVIAGVVGRNKLSYDIWGSTVNTASRMESSGEAGQINISGNTYMLVSEYFDCTYRGKMPVKNKGDIEMYFVKGIKAKLSVDMLGIKPNDEFLIQLQLVRLGDLEDFILEKLEKGLPKKLSYHNLKHTVDVYTQVELIGRAEQVTNEELLLLRTAALLHDAGHLIDYDTHEEMAVKLAHEILPEYYYSEKQIEVISDLIMSTKLPPKPKNLLEEIMCDADLDYLGREDFIPVSNMLYKELHDHGKIGTLREWNELQIKFISKHSYFTKTARKLRNVNKKSQLDKLRKWMEEN